MNNYTKTYKDYLKAEKIKHQLFMLNLAVLIVFCSMFHMFIMSL